MGITETERKTKISSMKERTEFSSPLDEMIADKFRSSDMFFKHLDNPNEKKESYFPLPKRFAMRLENLPVYLKLNVGNCMRSIYREGLDWAKEMSFHYLKEHTNEYPYESAVVSNVYTLKELYESYWLRDMIYVKELRKTNLEFVIRLIFDTDKIAENNQTIRLSVDVNCRVSVDGHIGNSIENVTTELV